MSMGTGVFGLALWGGIVSVLLTAALTSTASPTDGPRMTAEQHHRTSERVIEHHSFSPPLLRNYYGEDELRHWAIGGTTVITDNYVRLTADRPGQVGHLWNTEPLDMPSFEIVVGFHLHGKGTGADGFALWITTDRPSHNGPLMGRPMEFTGLGIIFDTYDNDGLRDNPAVYVLFNDETQRNRQYNTQKDFKGEYVGRCNYAYRQTSALPSTARIRYEVNTLQIFLSLDGERNELQCTTISDLRLPIGKGGYYIGLSAETGDLTDSHDILFVHTMPIEGVSYDHDVYSRRTLNQEVESPRILLFPEGNQEEIRRHVQQQQQQQQQQQYEQPQHEQSQQHE
ncbi:lectin, putative [Trypanosoma cruzi]|nr:lectin, putative [Trypanosoma cruzi]